MKNPQEFLLSIYFAPILILFCGIFYTVPAQGNCTGNGIFIEKTCAGDSSSADEAALFEIVNKYRTANGRPALRLSSSLSMLANRRMLDLGQNLKSLTHSWSNCPYDITDDTTWPCVIDAPRRLNSGYDGKGYETLYRTATGTVSPTLALETWKKSSLHNSIILNQGIFKDLAWDEVGIAIDGKFAAMWFGYPDGASQFKSDAVTGLGGSYEQAVSGLAKMLSIDKTSSTIENNIWRGFSSDKGLKLEIFGTFNEIKDANVGITVKLDPNGKIDPDKKIALTTLLKNLFPEWPDIDIWLENSINAISQNSTASKTKLVRKIAISLRSEAPNSTTLSIKPHSKPSYIEVF